MVTVVFTMIKTSTVQIAMERITERYRFGVLLISFNARKSSVLPFDFFRLLPFFFLKRSPVCPFRIASMGESFFTFRVHP